jgi:hypothetical protein
MLDGIERLTVLLQEFEVHYAFSTLLALVGR